MFSKIRINQSQKINVSPIFSKIYCVRYAYERSADTIQTGNLGQDYLAVNYEPKRLSFVLCDGVSQSFFGDLAAKILGNALVDWLFTKGDLIFEPKFDIEEELKSFLDDLIEEGQNEIKSYQLPDGLAPMLSSVLEKKRTLGSETTFTSGYISLNKKQIFLAWMGDSRLRIWNDQKETSNDLLNLNNFQTSERWSTNKGRVGRLHTTIISTSSVKRLITYSDGLARLDTKIENYPPSIFTLNQVIEESKYLPSSDDISFFEYFQGVEPSWYRPQPKALSQSWIVENTEKDEIVVKWQPIKNANKYELVISSSSGWHMYEVSGPRWSINRSKLPQGKLLISIRYWLDGEASSWSHSKQIEIPQISYPEMIPSNSELNYSYPIHKAGKELESNLDRKHIFTTPVAQEISKPKFNKFVKILISVLILLSLSIIFLKPDLQIHKISIFDNLVSDTVRTQQIFTNSPVITSLPSETQTATQIFTLSPTSIPIWDDISSEGNLTNQNIFIYIFNFLENKWLSFLKLMTR